MCGHFMAGFDGHKRCARCRNKLGGDDPCVIGEDCRIKGFTQEQRARLAIPVYQVKKNRKLATLSAPVSPASNVSIAASLQAISTQVSALDAKYCSVATCTNKLEAFLVAKSLPVSGGRGSPSATPFNPALVKREPVEAEVEVIFIEDDSNPEGTPGHNMEDNYEITVNPIESDGEDIGPISNGQPSLHPTGLFLHKSTSQDDEKLSAGREDGTRPVPTRYQPYRRRRSAGTGQKFWWYGDFNCDWFGQP